MGTTWDAGNAILIRGARTHNLKNINVEIPREQLVCITGRSGSGKSSLAFGTLFAEGQRQYIESLSLYSRQFFNQLQKADVDEILGLQPTLSLDQHVGSASRRSTVATITEIYDFLRVLMARAGEIRCHGCGKQIRQQTTQQIRDSILALPEDTKLMLLAPMKTGRKGAHQDVFETIRKERLVRVRVDGEVHDIEQVPLLDSNVPHTIEAITDRIIIREGIEQRLTEGIDLATQLGNGTVIASYMLRNPAAGESKDWQEKLFSTRYACPDCDINYAECEPRTFSFNSPYGACPECEGMGEFTQFDPALVVPDRSKPLNAQPVIPWNLLTAAKQKKQLQALTPLLEKLGVDLAMPLSQLNQQDWEELFCSRDPKFPGIGLLLEKEMSTTLQDERLDELEMFLGDVECPACSGSRLNAQANSVYLADNNMGAIVSMSLEKAAGFFGELLETGQLDDDQTQIAKPIVENISNRLKFLNEVGVGYLQMKRKGPTLSGGELQRVRLASSIGSGLTNVCYVLDEPSIGLHPRDNSRLLDALRGLKNSGNSVVVVEHDEEIIRAADHVIDIGPGAGSMGGDVVFSGTITELEAAGESLTGSFLSGRESVSRAGETRTPDRHKLLKLTGANGFNLSSVEVEIPLGLMTCVTGVSGSGKSTLINKTLVPALRQSLGLLAHQPEPFDELSGSEQIERIVHVDQKPLGKNARGCAATYSGVFADIRKLFAATRTAKERGYGASRFSFNAKDGRCPDCLGLGFKHVKMNFLSDMFVECQTCFGKRYNEATLEVYFGNHNIADILEMPISVALDAFANFSKIHSVLKCLDDTGLGYLPLGQPANTLSGGEAQRIKLATELSKNTYDKTLYFLDEPTTGLHFHDVRGLLNVLHQLVEAGHTVVVIEHNLDMIRSADWVIDLGPEGGEGGGTIVAVGTPREIAQNKSSITGRFL